jgi:allantoin racemase
VLEIEEDLDRAKRMMVDEARIAIRDEGAEAILLGCAGLGPIDKPMQEELGVPVFDGTACAVKLIESLLAYGVSTSKVAAFMAPEPKELVDSPPSLNSVYDRPRQPTAA